MAKIKWKTVNVDINKIKPTPGNYKLKTKEGLAHLQTSHKKYGRAGVIVVNLDFTIINGNSNWEEAKKNGEKKIDVSIPSRLLNKNEFKEFAAMFDAIRAGEVDMLRIKKELGGTKDFLKTWGLSNPEAALETIAELEKSQGKAIPTSKSTQQVVSESSNKPLTLLFTVKENEMVLTKAESLYAKYKVDNITDLVVVVFGKKNLL